MGKKRERARGGGGEIRAREESSKTRRPLLHTRDGAKVRNTAPRWRVTAATEMIDSEEPRGAPRARHNGDQKYETGIKFIAVARGDVRPRLRCK